MTLTTYETTGPAGTLLRPGAQAHRTADALRALGVLPRHRVALHASNSPAFVAVLLGLMQLGAGVVLVDHLRSPRSAAAAAARAGADRLIHEGPPSRERTGPVPSLSLDAPALRGALLDEEGPAEPPAPLPGETAPARTPGTPERWTAAAPLPLDAWARRDDALIAWSSGSTGEPKAIVRSGRSVLANTRRTVERMGYRDDDVLAPLLPFSHQYGFSLVLLAHLSGCRLLVTPYRRLDRALDTVAAHRATVVDATPSVHRSLLRLAELRPERVEELRAVRLWCTGGGPLDAALARDFRATMGRPLLDGYGSTELGNVALAGPDAPEDCLPLPGLQVSVRDPEGRPLPPGEPGEVWVRTPDATVGLLDADGTTVRPPGDGDFRTHDLGVLDARGGLRVLGRMSAVTRHGYTLYPAALARRAERCGRPVHVAAVRHGDRETRLVFVVEDPLRRSPAAWAGDFQKVLEPYELPNLVLVLDAFPLSSNGKTDVSRLEERARRALAKGEQT
ncbi:class I adenylate-forming enzyme family protein [Streptomyces sp. NPDC008159]|uniref:class I adenylate-forming enzyme family protein n=1 Tax=Streptomyces sp. NPDC008159 TaxID=3364817 RepID=UPI0036E17F44